MDGLGKASRRRQWTALILSGIFPGLGQLYVCAWAKGIAFLGAGTVIAWFLGQLVSLEDLLVGRLTHPLAALMLVLALLALFLWSIVDAWRAGGEPCSCSQSVLR